MKNSLTGQFVSVVIRSTVVHKMEGLQTTEIGETTLAFSEAKTEAETEGGLKGTNKKDKKELFQINTVRA